MKYYLLLALLLLNSACSTTETIAENRNGDKKIKILIVDGQDNHNVWPFATDVIKRFLEESGAFSVDLYRTQFTWKGENWLAKLPLNDGRQYISTKTPQPDPDFAPAFDQYAAVILNIGWKAASWPEQTKRRFESYMKNGGGLVVFHAANNAFPKWQAYNEMIGVGGWGGRNHTNGPFLYIDEQGEIVRDTSRGGAGKHGKVHVFTLDNRLSSHPIMQGLPDSIPHSRDELYRELRGPAKNLTILASAYDSPEYNGGGRHEPVLMTIQYHKGRVFHSTLGHAEEATKSETFKLTMLRGTEWAATGRVDATK